MQVHRVMTALSILHKKSGHPVNVDESVYLVYVPCTPARCNMPACLKLVQSAYNRYVLRSVVSEEKL